jgi:hypothetical protein
MKNKGLIVTSILFFLLINTSYFWEGKLGGWAFPAFFVLILVYCGLAVGLLQQTYFAIMEKQGNKQRVLIIILLLTVLCLTFLYPAGIVNFDKLSGSDILIAQREGSANCMTTFKLKERNKFSERSVCFGVTEVKGKYRFVNDTVFFEDVELGRYQEDFYQFAVIKPSRFNKNKNALDLIMYKDKSDTVGHELWITKNILFKQKD